MEASGWTGEYLRGKVALIIGAKEIEATISLAGTGSSVFSPGWLNTPSRQNKGPPSTPEPTPEKVSLFWGCNEAGIIIRPAWTPRRTSPSRPGGQPAKSGHQVEIVGLHYQARGWSPGKILPRLLKLTKIQPDHHGVVVRFNLTLRAKFKRWQANECGGGPQINYAFFLAGCRSRADMRHFLTPSCSSLRTSHIQLVPEISGPIPITIF